jgi:hypothetical protein
MTTGFSHFRAYITQGSPFRSMCFDHSTNLFAVLLCFSLAGLFSSCNSPLPSDAYVAWVRDYDNGLHVMKQFSGYNFDLQYQPLQYVMLQRTGQAVVATKENGTTLQYYTLAISLENKTADLINYNVADISERQRKLYYFSYEFQHDISLEENGKILPCALFHFERDNGISNISTFVLAFEGSANESKEATLVINSGHFSALPVRIKISKDNIPSLAI